MGFLLGPAFATGVSVGSKLIPVELQPSGLGAWKVLTPSCCYCFIDYAVAMIFVMAQAGGKKSTAICPVVMFETFADPNIRKLGAIFPAITGVIASSAGVGTLQPILAGLLFAMAISWMLVPDPKKIQR